MATLVNDGLERRARRMFADTEDNFQYCAIGRDTKAEANDDSTLGDEITTGGCVRMVADTKQYVADYKSQWIAQWSVSATLAIEEAAIFDHATLKIVEDCEDAWDELVDGDVTSTADADCKVGTKSAKLVVAAPCAAGDILATEVIASSNLTTYEYVNLWVKSSVALDSGDIQLLLDDTASCASPIKSLNFPAIGAAAWTLIQLDLGDASGLTAVVSVGVKMIVDKGAFNLFIDHVHCPGTMLMRHNFAATKNIDDGDTLQLTFTETESRA